MPLFRYPVAPSPAVHSRTDRIARGRSRRHSGRGLCQLFIAVMLGGSVAQSHAATLAECEKVKQQQLKAQRSTQAQGRKKSSSSSRGPSRSRQSIDKLEEWLWKNCGSYAHELRNLEQSHM